MKNVLFVFKASFVATLLFFHSILFAQIFSEKDADSLHWKIYDYWQSNSPSVDSAQSEVLLITLKTDSNSKINSVHVLSDRANIGATFFVLNKLTPAVFKGWKPKHYPNASILIPVYCSGFNVRPGYADSILCSPTLAGLDSKILWHCKESVMTSGIYMMAFGIIKEYRIKNELLPEHNRKAKN